MQIKQERLSHAQEIELTRALKNAVLGTPRYQRHLDTLVLANLGLVHKIVGKFPIKNASVSYDDLYQEGVAGLIKGIQKFDPRKGYRLSTYVYRWISAYVSRYFANHSRNVRIPVHVSEAHHNLQKQVEKLTIELGRTPTIAEVCSINKRAVQLIDDMKYTYSLNSGIGDDSELNDVCGEDKTEEFETCVDCDILIDKLREVASDRDYNILMMRYGLHGYHQHTLDEVAQKYELTRARIHQVEQKMVKLMRRLAV